MFMQHPIAPAVVPGSRAARSVDAVTLLLESKMNLSNYKIQTEQVKKYVDQGVEQGLKQGREQGLEEGTRKQAVIALFAVLAVRKRTVSDAERARIEACDDLPTLGAWLARAVSIESTVALFTE